MRRPTLIVIGCLVVVAAGLALWFGARPAYRHHKELAAVASAKKYLEAGDFRNASLSARQARLLNSSNIEAAEVMAQLAQIAGSPQALDWRRLVAELAPTVDNKLRLASVALLVQPPPCPVAAQTLEELAPQANGLASFHAVSAELALKLKNFPQAEAEFVETCRLDPSNQFHRLNLAVLRLGATNEARAAEARATLEGLRANTNLAPVALRWLVEDRLNRKDLPGAENYSQALLAEPKSGLEDRLQHLTILQRAGRPELQGFLEATQKAAATNATAVYAVASWMTANSLADQARQWLTRCPPTVQAELPVPLAVADCYIATKDWAGLETFLEEQKWGEQDFRRLAWMSRATEQQKRAQAAEAHWRLAVRQAGERLGPLAWLCATAGAWERVEAKEALLWQLARQFPRERWVFRELGRTYEAAGNTGGLQRLYAAMTTRDPKDLVAKNNLATTSLLLKTNLPQAHLLAQELYAQRPQEPIPASTYAYSLYLQGRTIEGLAALEKLQPTALENPVLALYYGVLLQADNQSGKAAKYLALVQRDKLLPEEKDLLAQTLRGM